MNKTYASRLNRSEYPFVPNFIQQKNYNQHYIDQGSGDTIVFIHGTPSWTFDFRNVIKPLSKKYRCIAADHIGFGLSDKPADYNYSIQQHSQNLEKLIDTLELNKITLVLHDFGGPVGIDLALRRPELVSRMVIINSWTGSSENLPEYKKLKRILKSPLLPFLYLRLNFSARFILPSSFGTKKISRSLLKNYTLVFPNRNSRYGTLAFAKSLLNDQPLFQTQMEQMDKLSKIPVMLIWGMKDSYVTTVYAERFKSRLNVVQFEKIETAGHFPQEEEPEKVTDALIRFLENQRLN